MNQIPTPPPQPGASGRHARAVADRPALRGAAAALGRAAGAGAVVRVLPAEERGAGDPALDLHPPAGAAGAALRQRHLRRRRQHPGAHPCDRGPHRRRDVADAGRPPDLRRRLARRGGRRGPAVLGRRRPPHRGPARRRAGRARTTSPHPAGLRLCGGPGGRAEARRRTSRSRSRPIRRRIPTARSAEHDLDNLKRKLDAGATRAITQYFFEGAMFLRFLDRALAAGITAPIVPGIMPVSNFAQAAKFSAMCGTSVPGLDGRAVRGHRGRRGNPPHGRGDRRGRAGAAAAGQRGRRVPLLHAEPAGPDLRHRPPAGRPAERPLRRREASEPVHRRQQERAQEQRELAQPEEQRDARVGRGRQHGEDTAPCCGCRSSARPGRGAGAGPAATDPAWSRAFSP